MARIHLFEFEDQKWFPSFLRNYGTDFLQFLANKTKLFKPALPLLEETLRKTGNQKIVDLASGGGGGLLWLNAELQKQFPDLSITLTDYYPNIPAFQYTQKQAPNIGYASESIDARDVPEHLEGLRTQFLSLHHFKSEDAVQILQNAVDSKNAIALFEAQERSLPSFFGMFISPITLWLTTPFIRPFKWGRILFTYLIPITPLFVWWDGMVSALRTYSVKEMNGLVTQVKRHETFNWNIGRIKSGPTVVLYLIGTQKPA